VKPITFHVEAAGEFRPVDLTFADAAEVRKIRSWRKILPASDAGEFAALAAKRWFYYTREGAAVGSLQELRSAMRRRSHAELAFLLVASATWAKRYKFLALAYCRRTWCHHLVLDFLAVRPGLTVAGQPIRGIGTGMISTIAGLAYSLGIERIWGEATANSAAFYEKVLEVRPVKDLFIIERKRMCEMHETYAAHQKHRLARTGK
jgi:hypothetical protein